MTTSTSFTSTNIANIFPTYKEYIIACSKFWASEEYIKHLAKERKVITLHKEEDNQFDKDGVIMSKRIYKNKIDAHPIDKSNYIVNMAIDEHLHKHFENSRDESENIKKIDNMLADIIKSIKQYIMHE